MNRQLVVWIYKQRYGGFNEQIGGQIKKQQIGRYVDEGINRQSYKYMDMRRDKWMGMLMYRWMSRFMSRYKKGRQISGWINGWIYKQMDSGWVDG